MRPLFLFLFFLHVVPGKAQLPAGRKILIVTTSADNMVNKPDNHNWGAYTPEIVDFCERLYKSGISMKDIDVMNLKGGKVPLAGAPSYSKQYPDGERKLLEEKLEHALSPAQITADDYRVIYYAGGFSCLVDYPTSDSIGSIAATVYEKGGIVAAVCDGVCGLLPVKLGNNQYLVAGKQIAANGNNAEKGTQKKLIDLGAVISDEKLAVDHNIITAKGVRPISVAEEVLRLLGYEVQH